MTRLAAFVSSGLLGLTVAAQAGAPVAHPAMAADASANPQLEANAKIVGHPASPRWAVRHANHEHPAVAQTRPASIDPSRFLVQPPASVQWTLGPATPTRIAGTR